MTVKFDQDSVQPFVRSVVGADWPQPLRIGQLMLGTIGLLLFGVAALLVWMGVDDQKVDLVLIGAGGAVFGLYLCTLGAKFGGVRHLGLPRRIVVRNGALQVPMSRQIAVLCVFLAMMGIFGFTAAASWYWGIPADFAFRPDTPGEARLLACAGIVLPVVVLLLTLFREPTRVSISADGITRHTKRWIVVYVRKLDLFVPWDDVVDLVPDETVSHGLSEIHFPFLWIRTRTSRSKEERFHLDTETDVKILVNNLVAEPNTFLALLRFLKDNPDQRGIVARDDARELLRPPPLWERFRAAREKQGAK